MCNNGPCQICTEVAEVDEEINQTLRRLLAKRCDLLSEHNRIHETLMNRLPIELKNHIFKLLLPSRDEWGVTPRRERNAMLACISVCRGWRDIALSNPFLWSSMHIVLRTPNLSNRINDWILRSQTLPVTYHIRIDDNKEYLKQSREAVADVMSRCSHRLQSLSLDAPLSVLFGSRHNNFRYHRLRRLRIISSRSSVQFNQPLSLLNPTASPENIEFRGVSFASLQISWNCLTTANVDFDLKDLIQLFQNASQMTYCEFVSLRSAPIDASMPPIVHHRLKTLIVHSWAAPILLGSLTLPCLKELSINDTALLTHLPALVQRSSCPLTKLILFHVERWVSLDELQPLTGVTDLVVVGMVGGRIVIKSLLLDVYYFPDLRHLTLRFQPFIELWDAGVIPLLLDRKRADERGLDKFIVVDQGRTPEFDLMWNSDVGEELKALNIDLREDGFEFL